MAVPALVSGGDVDADEDGKPPVDERLKWFLLPTDIEAVMPQDMLACRHADIVDEPPTVPRGEAALAEMADAGDRVPEIVRRAAMLRRRKYPVPSDLLPEETPFSDRQRQMSMRAASNAREEKLKERFKAEDVPTAVRPWVDFQESKVDRMLEVLRTVKNGRMTTLSDISQQTGISEGSLSGYLGTNKELKKCIEDLGKNQPYAVTQVGERVLNVDWTFVFTGTRET